MPNAYLLVCFDGYCGLCNGTVDWLMRHDKKQRFRYTSLQSKYAQQLLANYQLSELPDSILVLANGKVYTQANAVLLLLNELSGVWKMLAAIGKLVPISISNRFYRIIAKNRYRWFGKRETCRIPNASEKALFFE